MIKKSWKQVRDIKKVWKQGRVWKQDRDPKI